MEKYWDVWLLSATAIVALGFGIYLLVVSRYLEALPDMVTCIVLATAIVIGLKEERRKKDDNSN